MQRHDAIANGETLDGELAAIGEDHRARAVAGDRRLEREARHIGDRHDRTRRLHRFPTGHRTGAEFDVQTSEPGQPIGSNT